MNNIVASAMIVHFRHAPLLRGRDSRIHIWLYSLINSSLLALNKHSITSFRSNHVACGSGYSESTDEA